MSDWPDHASAAEKKPPEEDQPKDDGPQFGVIDIVEAFTAMRHEWRGQTRESRQLAEQIQAAAATLGALETKLLNHAAFQEADENSLPAADDAKKLAQLVAQTDHEFTRAVGAIERAEKNRRRREEEDARALRQYVAGRSALVRWCARGVLKFLAEQRQRGNDVSENPAVEGLNLVLARLRRSMKQLRIERVETQGRPFDANTMHAIGTTESSEYPAGHVAEQLSPCYRWHGQILMFADVRVAN